MVFDVDKLKEALQIEGHHNNPTVDCRMVEGWWMPTGKDET